MTEKELLHLFSKGEIIREIINMQDGELIEKFRIALERDYSTKLEVLNEKRTNYNPNDKNAVKSLITINRAYEKVEKVYREIKEYKYDREN